jgi:hypothetical protein
LWEGTTVRLYHLWGECDLTTQGLVVFAALVVLSQFVEVVVGIIKMVARRRKTSSSTTAETLFSLVFCGERILPGGQAELSVKVETDGSLFRIHVHDSIVKYFEILDLKICGVSQVTSAAGGIPACVFVMSEDTCRIRIDPVHCGDWVSLVVRNWTAEPHDFSAVVHGRRGKAAS